MEFVFPSVSPIPFVVVCTFVLLDVIVGLCKAFATGTYASDKMRAGLWHKTGVLAIVVLAYALEVCSGLMDFDALGIEGFSVPVASVVAGYIVLMETGSVIESVGVINPELRGTKLLKLFGQAVEHVDPEQTSIFHAIADVTEDAD